MICGVYELDVIADDSLGRFVARWYGLPDRPRRDLDLPGVPELLPLLVFMYGIARDRDLMGDHTASRPAAALYLATIAVIALCVGALFVLSVA